MGIIASALLYGQENKTPWIGETDGNGYRLINPDDPQAIKFFFVGPEPGEEGRRTVSVQTLILQGDGAIGLLYGYQDQPKSYYLLLLDGGKTVTAYHRPPEGGLHRQFHVELSSNGEGNGPLLLTMKIVEDGDTPKIWLDDNRDHFARGSGGRTGQRGDRRVGPSGRPVYRFRPASHPITTLSPPPSWSTRSGVNP